MKKICSLLVVALLLAATMAFPVAAQNKAPDAIPGEVVYIPFPVKITLDGDASDWAGIPIQTVTTGPKKSPHSKQSKSFDFAVAADETNLYYLMKIADSKVITGKHGKDFWNEDSMEFYFNFTGNLATKAYAPGIAQINIPAINIGKKAGDAITVIGSNSETVKVNAAVVKTADGWMFEASVPLANIKPEHGLTIGIQAQANGATEKDRDTKLIWSKKDKGDGSYQDPSLFGKGVFFKVGSADTPKAQ